MWGRAVVLVAACSFALVPIHAAGAGPQAPAASVSGAPFGNLDVVRRLPDAIRLTGWSADPDTSAPLAVHVYIDGVGTAIATAGLERPDVGRAYPALGSQHGFDVTVSVAQAPHTVCVYAINVGPGGNQQIGCAFVGGNTIGSLDAATRRPGHLELRGWALDPDVASSTPIHVYVDGVGAGIGTADVARPDVERWMPGYGAAHGFDIIVPAVGSRTVCAYAISSRGKPNLTLGCVRTSGEPLGMLDAVTRPGSGGALRVRGWALDPDVAISIPVHVYIDGIGRAVGAADASRPDVGQAFSDWGAAHGYDLTINGVDAGIHQVCTYGISVGGSANALLGCRTTAVSAPVDVSLIRTVLTADGHDSFGLDVAGPSTVATAPRSNGGTNTRIAFRRVADAIAENEGSCATWTSESAAVNQQGVALRINQSPTGARRAITMTKNVYLGAPWIFNAHLWDTRSGAGITQIAAFDLSSVFRSSGRIRPLPWNLCARVVGSTLSFVAWPGSEPRPTWSDPAHGGSVRLPDGWDYPGTAGWYVGHLRPGDSTTFTGLRAGPVSGDTAPGALPNQDGTGSTFAPRTRPRAPTALHILP